MYNKFQNRHNLLCKIIKRNCTRGYVTLCMELIFNRQDSTCKCDLDLFFLKRLRNTNVHHVEVVSKMAWPRANISITHMLYVRNMRVTYTMFCPLVTNNLGSSYNLYATFVFFWQFLYIMPCARFVLHDLS